MPPLREDTQRVWNFLRGHPALAGFTLVGGTALALRIGHRLSEDLDFAFNAVRLPRARLEALKKAAREHGIAFVANDPPQAVEDFEIAGMDLLDYQQNHLAAGSVKVTFFAPDEEARRHLVSGVEEGTGPRVAEQDELFAMKCLVCADRSKTRDWFDLYVLMHDHGYTPSRLVDVFVASGVPQKMAIALNRLSRGRPHEEDEGYQSLLADPPTLAEMSAFFTEVADAAQAELARRQAAVPGGPRRRPPRRPAR
jgi:hypothetical protein